MNAFFHLKLISSPLKFFEPILIKDAVNANADNYSTAEVMNLIKKLAADSERIFVFVELTNADPGTTLPLIMSLLKVKHKTKVVHSGANDKLKFILEKLNSQVVDKDSAKGCASKFFNQL